MRRTSLLLAVLISLPALGYELTDKDWTWQVEPVEVPFQMNLDSWNITGLDTADVSTAYQNSAERWSEPLSGARVTAEYAGDTIDLDLDLDNVHIARYVDGAYPGATVALASVWSYTNGTGAGFNPWDIADCDIEFFGENDFGEIIWSVEPTGPDTLEMDFELVATHELGHCLGLDHSAEVDAVMYESAPPGTPTDWRDLDQDDLDGIYAIYGAPPDLDLSASSPVCDDGNGILEPGDVCSFDATITDLAQVGTASVSMEWTNTPGELKFAAASYSIGDLLPTGDLTLPISFEVDSGCTTSGDVVIDYFLLDDFGRVWHSVAGDVDPIILTLDCAPPLQLPELEFSLFTFTELVGDADGLIEAGETIRYEVFVENTGTGNAANVSAETTTTSTDLSITNSPVSVGDFDPGDLFSFDIDFDVDSNCTGNQSVTMDVQLTDSTGLSWDFDLPVELMCSSSSPEFNLSSYTPSETSGDGDGLIEAGEEWSYGVLMENTGSGEAIAVSAYFTSSDPFGDVTILNGNQGIGDFYPGDTKTFEIDFEVDGSCTSNQTVYLEVEFEDTSGEWWDLSDTLPVDLTCTSGPQLELDSYSFDDAIGGNGDGLVQEGETIRYTLVLINEGNGNAEAATVHNIDPFDADVSALTAVPLSMGDLGPGDSYFLDFDLLVDPACTGSRGTTVAVELDCGAGVSCQTDLYVDLELDCSAPSGLYIDSYTYTEDDADNLIEAGETANYTITVRNPDAVDYTGVQATITSNHPDVSVGTPVVQAVSANGVIESNDASFLETVEITIAQDCVSSEITPLTIVLEDDAGLSWTHELDVELWCSNLGALVIESVEVYDEAGVINGNGDGVLQEGETGVELYITLYNPTNGEIAGPVLGYIVTHDSNFDPGSHELEWGYFEADESQISTNNGYLDVYEDCVGTEALFDLQIYDQNYILSHTEEFSLPIDCDEDDDGFPASEDCDDLESLSYPGNPELCDGIDNDCDGDIDNGITNMDSWFADSDGDGYGDADDSIEACVAPAGYVDDNTDCDDTNGSISPGAAEICDELDNDCTGFADDGLLLYTLYADTDGDGFGDPNVSVDDCGPSADYVDDNTDCDDTQYSVAPNRTEICDGLDNDCDVDIDEDCEADDDGDGWGESLDCDDTDSAINPDADELCDGVDNNCDGDIDINAIDGSTYYADNDGDGYGDPQNELIDCTAPAGSTSNNEDCNDSNAAIKPGAVELCNGVDEDCDGLIDDDCQTDEDGDGYSSLVDCDDEDSSVNPGVLEVCDGIDNDCDAIIDDDATNLQISYLDADGDGFGTGATEALGCDIPQGYVDNNLDCDDSTASRSPDNAEMCDGIDNDCDLLTDNDAVDAPTWYADKDGDGFGDPNSPLNHCELQQGMVSNDLDCNDAISTIYPQAPEIWYDGIDQDCDGIDDDRDRDGYPNAEDCDDTNNAVFPGSGHFDDDCEPITTAVEHKMPKPNGGGGCALPLPASLSMWWLPLAISLRRRQRQAPQ